ncbi:MAG: hypothetical protein ABR956_03455 [Terracidiphilus sp.]|jgi:peptidoglycan-associated lipoprotein
MRLRIKYLPVLLLTIAAVSSAPAAAQAAPENAKKPFHFDLALDYSYAHSNAPPGGCGCFNLNGGSATLAFPIKRSRFALVADGIGVHGYNITSADYEITLSAYTGGVRYLPRFGHSTWQPFGQVLVGVAHSSGTLVQGPQSPTTNSGAAFAANVGGGLDKRINHRFSIRLIDADYLVTTFDNNVNNHQNNTRISAGVVIHF